MYMAHLIKQTIEAQQCKKFTLTPCHRSNPKNSIYEG